MPEGPEIRRAADRIFKAVGGVPVELVFHIPELEPWNDLFQSTRIERIETRGKAMLTWLSGGYVLYSHNQLYGRWEVLAQGKASRSRRSLRLEIRSSSHTARLLSATDIAILHEDELHEHPFLQKLGPDALDLATTPAIVRKRLRDKAWKNKRLASLYLDQAFIAGIGNYLRSEILFVSGVDPLKRPASLTTLQIKKLAESTLTITRRSLETGGVTLDAARAKRLLRDGVSRRQRRHYVFGRTGQSCFQCDTTIERIDLAGRALFVCPTCQMRPDLIEPRR
jgi:endonuclease-8